MTLRIATITIDCADPQALARWWAEALGWSITYDSPDEVVIKTPEGEIASPLLFGKMPDAKVVKNRLHIDLRPDDRDAEVARLEGLGARRVDIGQGPDVTWVVMADPENNEFCVLRALRPDELADS
jgi:predicted enzyme related to lactoylglutathione lyase